MPSGTHPRPRCPRRIALLGALLALPAVGTVLGACEATTAPQRDTEASYWLGTLSCELAEKIRVPAAAAAADAALRERGYSVVNDDRTEDRAVLRARKLGDKALDKVTVKAHVGKASTELSVRVEPFGDEVVSRAILDAILVRLGR